MAQINIPRHPEIKKNLAKYARMRTLIENDEDEYASKAFCLELPNEAPNARKAREKLFVPAFRNITLDLLGAIRDAVFRDEPRLEFNDENGTLSTFAEDVTRARDKTDLITYAKNFVTLALRGFGQVWTVMDKPSHLSTSFLDELRSGMPYICNVPPEQVINYELVNGRMAWFAYQVDYVPNWDDPTSAQPDTVHELRVWTADRLIIADAQEGRIKNEYPHSLGMVPVVYQSLYLPPDRRTIIGIAPFFTSSNLIIMANNMKSIADMELAKFGNSLLLVHEESLSGMNTEVDGEGSPKTKVHDAGGMNSYVWHGEHPPAYLTKDLDAVTRADDRAAMYFNWAIENERTMHSIKKQGKDGQDISESGVAKTFDASPVLAGLRATATAVENWCQKVLNMIWVSTGGDLEAAQDQYVCEFPKNYDVMQRALNERLDEIEKMVGVKYPSTTGLKEAYKGITPQITTNTDIQQTINDEIDEADIDGDEAEIEEAANREFEEDRRFEAEIANLPPEEQERRRAERRFNTSQTTEGMI